MSGYHLVLKIRRLEEECSNLGFMLCYPKYGNSEYDMIALKPKDQESLPIYARDAEPFRGTIEELEVWIRGVEWARQYDKLLRLSDEQKRARKEQDERNRRLVEVISNGK
jgi:elongation factor P--beta-lysine ligase